MESKKEREREKAAFLNFLSIKPILLFLHIYTWLGLINLKFIYLFLHKPYKLGALQHIQHVIIQVVQIVQRGTLLTTTLSHYILQCYISKNICITKVLSWLCQLKILIMIRPRLHIATTAKMYQVIAKLAGIFQF